VAHGSMYPPMELLLRHAIQYLDLPSLVRMDDARFDCVEELRAALPRLPRREQQLVACVQLLAKLLDGNFRPVDLRFFEDLYSPSACEAAEQLGQASPSHGCFELVSPRQAGGGGLEGAGTPDLIKSTNVRLVFDQLPRPSRYMSVWHVYFLICLQFWAAMHDAIDVVLVTSVNNVMCRSTCPGCCS
jgi:hypothetical protein